MQAVCSMMRVCEAEMSRFGSVQQGLVSDIRTNDSVHVQSLQIRYLSAETLLVDTLHRHRWQQVIEEVKLFSNLHQEGYIFTSVCLSVCEKIKIDIILRKVVYVFSLHFWKWCAPEQETVDYILGLTWIQIRDFFFNFAK